MKLNKIIGEFNMTQSFQDMILDKLYEYNQKHDISFDTENNDKLKDGQIKIDTDMSVLYQHWRAGGDWENPVSYYVCQVKEGMLNVDGSMVSTNDIFIYVPIKGNNNLRKENGGYSATDNSKIDDEDEDEGQMEAELKEHIKKCRENVKQLR